MINMLFLIKNEEEYRIAYNIIKSRQCKDFVILARDENPPFLVNKYTRFENVSQWADFGIIDLNLNRYSVMEFRKLEEIIRPIIERKYSNKLTANSYFITEVVWSLGDKYYKYIDALNKFFSSHRPRVVMLSPDKDFISELFVCFAGLYEARLESLKGLA